MKRHLDPIWRNHPETKARARAHAANHGPCPANGKDGSVDRCTCEPTAEQLADEWLGAARMAKARQLAGVSLSALDLQALDRNPDPVMIGAQP